VLIFVDPVKLQDVGQVGIAATLGNAASYSAAADELRAMATI
jgi:hypothetical protein